MYNFSFQVRVCLKKSTPPYYLLRLVSPNKRKNLQKVYQLFSPISCLASLAPPHPSLCLTPFERKNHFPSSTSSILTKKLQQKQEPDHDTDINML